MHKSHFSKALFHCAALALTGGTCHLQAALPPDQVLARAIEAGTTVAGQWGAALSQFVSDFDVIDQRNQNPDLYQDGGGRLADALGVPYLTPFGVMQMASAGPTPEKPYQGQILTEPPNMEWQEDPALDIVCGTVYHDLRPAPDAPVNFSQTFLVPKFRYSVCSRIFTRYRDAYLCILSGISEASYFDSWSYSKGNCSSVTPMGSRGTQPEWMGGSPTAWECISTAHEGLQASIPCRDSPFTDSCYDLDGTFVALSIYARSDVWCVRKSIGTVFEEHVVFGCNTQTVAVTLGDVAHALDPSLRLYPQTDGSLRFATQNPDQYQGAQEGYVVLQGHWLLFVPRQDTPLPMLSEPEAVEVNINDVLAAAIASNPQSQPELVALVTQQALATASRRNLVPWDNDPANGPVTAVELPQKLVGPCLEMALEIQLDQEAMLQLDGCLSDCLSSVGSNRELLLTWTSANVGGLKFLVNSVQLRGQLPSAPLAADGTLTLPVPTEDNSVTVSLFGTNLLNGRSLIRTLAFTPKTDAEVMLTNFAYTVTANPDATVTVNYTFDSQTFGNNPAHLVYTIRQGTRTESGTIEAPGLGHPLHFTTDTAGEVVFGLLNPCGTGLAHSDTITLSGPQPPSIELYSFYPDATSPRLLTEDLSPSTVKYRIHNPAPNDQTVEYRVVDQESGLAIHAGSFTNTFVDVTNNVRNTELTAWAETANSLKSPPARRRARIFVETPQLTLPNVLHNSRVVAVTNQTQARHAYHAQMFKLTASHGLNGLTNLYYPENGVIELELDGNNIMDPPGYWTNVLANVSVPHDWYQQGNLNNPLVTPAGFATASTRFDVAPLQVTTITNQAWVDFIVSTVTTNAQLVLEQRVGNLWRAIQRIPNRQGTFTNVNLGYETRIVGIKDRYNPATFHLDPVLFLELANDPCRGTVNVAVNPAVTNIAFVSSTYTTNVVVPASSIPDLSSGLLTLPLAELPAGVYTVTATGNGPQIIRNHAVNEDFGFDLVLDTNTPNSTLTFTGVNANGIRVYLLDVRSSANPRLLLNTARSGLSFASAQPAYVTRIAEHELEILTSALSVSFQIQLMLEDPGCPDTEIVLNGIVHRTTPLFDIPVSDPQSANCLAAPQ